MNKFIGGLLGAGILCGFAFSLTNFVFASPNPAPPSFNLTISSVQEAFNDKDKKTLIDVKISAEFPTDEMDNDKKEKKTTKKLDKENVYSIKNIRLLKSGGTIKLEFTKTEYQSLTKSLRYTYDPAENKYEFFLNEQGGDSKDQKSVGKISSGAELNLGVVELRPELKEIITGKVEYEDGSPFPGINVRGDFFTGDDDNKKLEGSLYRQNITTNSEGEFTVKGYNHVDIRYELRFADPQGYYKTEEKTVKLAVGEETKNLDKIVMDDKTDRLLRKEDIEAVTGFDECDLVPKYQIGAKCRKDKDKNRMKGDASDVTYWLQKFSGMITGFIGIIALIFFIWNAFKIVTAAGDTDQISRGKKGLIWTALGLGAAMFAYILVKTAITLTYTA